MKIKHVLIGMAACAALAGCASSENDAPDPSVMLEGDTYIGFKIASTGTRAGDFEDGTADENAIGNARFFFYDANGNYVTEGFTNSITENGKEDPNVEEKNVLGVILKDVQEQPGYVLALLNLPTADEQKLIGLSIDEARELLAASYREGNYFIMTNSTYADNGTWMDATPISTANLCKTEAAALEHPVTIYVERLAAKITVKEGTNIEINAGDVYEAGASEPVKPEIEILGWGLNATNKNGYYLKHIDPTATYFDNWNYAPYFRSYWAEDPNYTEGTYPANAAADNDLSSLNYFTALDIKDGGKTFGDSDYCLENTLAGDLLVGDQHLSAATHVIFIARLRLNRAGENETLVRYKGVFYTEEDFKRAAYNDLTANDKLWKHDDMSDATGAYVTLDPKTDINVKNVGDGKVNIELVNTDEPIYKDGYGTTPYTEDELKDLFAKISDAEGYNEGLMYYVYPIQHLNTAGEIETDDATGEKTYPVGYYGVVRNHSYQLTLTKVTGLGHPIWEEEESIVPNYDPDTYYIAAELNILSWHVVETNIEL